MTITLIGTGGVWTRLGVEGRCANNLNGLLSTTAPNPGSAWGAAGPTINDLADQINLIEAQYQSTNQQLIAGANDIYAARDAARSGLDSLKTTLQGVAQQTVITMANDDVGLPLDNTSLVAGLQELVRQMTSSGDTIHKPTITVTPANGTPTPTGNTVVTASVIGPTGKQLDYSYNEVLDIVVTTDSISGGATQNRETFSVQGDFAQTNLLSWDWPKGSAASATTTAGDWAENAGTNFLTYGGFDSFTVANTPDGWTIVLGAVGTNIFQENTDIYGTFPAGGHALKITGDAGLTLTTLREAITGLVTQSQVVALNAFVHVDAAAPAAGVLRFALVDGSGTIINDDAGTANSYSVLLTSATLQTTYKATGAMSTAELNGNAFSGAAGAIHFRLPTNLPTTVQVELKLTTAISNTKNVFIDGMVLRAALQAYGTGVAGGPYVSLFAGSTRTVLNDRYKVTVSNAYDSAFAKWAWRVFNLPSLGVLIPSVAGNTINENLIV